METSHFSHALNSILSPSERKFPFFKPPLPTDCLFLYWKSSETERKKHTGLRWILSNTHLQLTPPLGGFHQLPPEPYFGQSQREMQGAPRNGTGQSFQSQAAPAEILLSQTELVPTRTGAQDFNPTRKAGRGGWRRCMCTRHR